MHVTDTGAYTHFQIPVGNISVQELPSKIWIVWIINLIFLVQETGVHKKPFLFHPSLLKHNHATKNCRILEHIVI